MSDTINYGEMMQQAMQGLVKTVLTRVADKGLPGKHHFFITFNTQHPGVDMAAWLKNDYPQEITVVMQDWFADLAVMEDRFTITLNFGDNPEPMVIPFDAIKTFVDPSVEFGLRFDGKNAAAKTPQKDVDPDAPTKDAEVVSIETFRKK
ncbi:MAG: ClpXP protease specificity-enhancing factor SspB [Paracoccaceae bacterium]